MLCKIQQLGVRCLWPIKTTMASANQNNNGPHGEPMTSPAVLWRRDDTLQSAEDDTLRSSRSFGDETNTLRRDDTLRSFGETEPPISRNRLRMVAPRHHVGGAVRDHQDALPAILAFSNPVERLAASPFLACGNTRRLCTKLTIQAPKTSHG